LKRVPHAKDGLPAVDVGTRRRRKTLSELGDHLEKRKKPGMMRGLVETAMREEILKEEKNGKTTDEGKRAGCGEVGTGSLVG